jgi:hypothetical protein
MANTIGGFRRILFAVLMFIFVVSPFNYAQAQTKQTEKTVAVIGTSNIHGDNVSAARDQAISNSLVSAVQRVAEDLVPLDYLVRNFQTLNQVLYSNTDKFVRHYRVLTELKVGKKYRVMVQATVSLDGVNRHVSTSTGIVPRKKTMPRILFLIAEQTPNNSSYRYWWGKDSGAKQAVAEVAMARELHKRDFTVVKPSAKILNILSTVDRFKPELSNREAVDIGARCRADVVIVGKSNADFDPGNIRGSIKSYKGTLTARVLRIDTAAEIAATRQTAVAQDTDDIAGSREALSAAGRFAAEALAMQIATAWQSDIKQTAMVEIIVEGTRYLASFVKLRRKIKEMPGVKGMQIKEMKSDQATLTVDYQGDTRKFADELMLNSYESFSINIREVSADYLRISLIPG